MTFLTIAIIFIYPNTPSRKFSPFFCWRLAVIIWVVCSLMLVVGVKYYTSLELRKLERRLERVKDGLQQVKEKFQMAQDRQQSVQSEESLFEERVKFMQENI